jgi:hypothetical protein
MPQSKVKESKVYNKSISAAVAAKPEKELVSCREEEFKKSLIPFLDAYGKEMIRQFYDYWRELSKSKTRMRWEMEKTWDLSLRLKKWQSNQDQFSKGKSAQPEFIKPKPINGVIASQGQAPLKTLN